MKALRSWRSHPVDGALLWFDPRSGVRVRWDGPETRSLRSTAPRFVMVGLTDRCNLSCSFCSRERGRAERWTAEGAFELLSGLAWAGVLEVAFGGGEPLLFEGFDLLLERLAQETPLAVHVTTNGLLLTPERLERIRRHAGEIRLSLYPQTPWRALVPALAAAQKPFGINLLVTPEVLPGLPAWLAELERLGCEDVALLSYVGADPKLHLSREEDRRLSDLIGESAIVRRFSACFGDRLPNVPRLLEGARDCGAGADSIVLTADKRLKACSFQREGVAVETAADVLRVWRERRDELAAAIGPRGCARPAPPASRPPDGLRVWQSFSGSNSGDCVLVGRFETSEEARRYVAELAADFKPGEPFSPGWRALLSSEGISPDAGYSPDTLVSAGPVVVLHTGMTLEDDFGPLRTLLWKRGGRAVYVGIHEHGRVELVAGLAFRERAHLEAAQRDMAEEGLMSFWQRGDCLFGVLDKGGTFEEGVARLRSVAQAHQGAVALECVPLPKDLDFIGALARAPDKAQTERLWSVFPSREVAARYSLEPGAERAGCFVSLERQAIRPRFGYRADAMGARSQVFPGKKVRVHYWLWKAAPPGHGRNKDEDEWEYWERCGAEFVPALRPCADSGASVKIARHEWRGLHGSVETSRPLLAIEALESFAQSRGLKWSAGAEPVDRLVEAIARIAGDLEAQISGSR